MTQIDEEEFGPNRARLLDTLRWLVAEARKIRELELASELERVIEEQEAA